MPFEPAHQAIDGLCDLRGMGVMGQPCRKQDDLKPIARQLRQAGCLSQDALAPIPEDRISQSLRRNEGDSCTAAFVFPQYCHADEPMIGSLATREDPFKIPFGLDGLHAKLDGQPLAALGATTCEDGAAALGGHTGTETMGLSALALVGLVRTLHDETLLGVVASNK